MAKRITTNLLVEVGACSEQRILFAELFPNGTEVTKELCIRYADEFDFDWAARYLLPVQAWQEYHRIRDEALAEYEHARDNAWGEYHRIRNKARAKCLRTQNKTWEEYCRIRDEAGAECLRTRGEAWAEYERICATEFARLWLEYMP